MSQKKLDVANSKSWYRGLKVVYILFSITSYVIASKTLYTFLELNEYEGSGVILLLGAVFIFIPAIVQKTFYYIYFGSVAPK